MKHSELSEREQVLDTARKWYCRIPFPTEWDAEFEALLKEQEDLRCMSFADYDLDQNTPGKDLVMFLYFCEELSARYKKAGISQDILLATVEDFVISVKRNRILTGKMGIVRASALKNHLSMQLFRIGRLQFCMTGAVMDIPAMGICKGDPVMDIHVPIGGPMTMQACKDAFAAAEKFFEKYFPQYHYRYYTCYSWLLDEVLQQFLNENSNILQFQKLFAVVHKSEGDSILHFMFRYGIETREELKNYPANTRFAQAVKDYALAGGVFYNVLGVMEYGAWNKIIA